MDWQALGGDPAPGDVDGVRQVAYAFREVHEHADSVARRLESLLGQAAGPIWTGVAADAFRARLTGVLPELRLLSASHALADRALTDHAERLDDAQALARRAAVAATAAWQERQCHDREAAAAEAEADYRQGLAAQAAYQARLSRRQAGTAAVTVVDPTEALRLQHQADADEVRRRRADAAVTAARDRQSAAVRATDRAEAELIAARRLGEQAAELHQAAGTSTVRRLAQAGDAGIGNRGALHRWWDDRVEDVRQVTASPQFHRFLGVLNNASAILGTVALFAVFIPGIGPALAGALKLLSVGLGVVAALGTVVAWAFGNATTTDAALSVVGAGFGLAGAVKLLKGGATAMPTLADRGVRLGGEIRRALNYGDARRTTGFLRHLPTADKLAGRTLSSLPVRVLGPERFFQARTATHAVSFAKDAYTLAQSPASLSTQGAEIVRDLLHFDEHPDPPDDLTHRAVDGLRERLHIPETLRTGP